MPWIKIFSAPKTARIQEPTLLTKKSPSTMITVVASQYIGVHYMPHILLPNKKAGFPISSQLSTKITQTCSAPQRTISAFLSLGIGLSLITKRATAGGWAHYWAVFFRPRPLFPSPICPKPQRVPDVSHWKPQVFTVPYSCNDFWNVHVKINLVLFTKKTPMDFPAVRFRFPALRMHTFREAALRVVLRARSNSSFPWMSTQFLTQLRSMGHWDGDTGYLSNFSKHDMCIMIL